MDNVQRDKYPCLHRHAVKMTSLSGSSYLYEQLFSRMKYTKSSARSALTDEHLQAVLRIATTYVAINFDALGKRSNVNRHIEHHHGSLIAAVLLLRWVLIAVHILCIYLNFNVILSQVSIKSCIISKIIIIGIRTTPVELYDTIATIHCYSA